MPSATSPSAKAELIMSTKKNNNSMIKVKKQNLIPNPITTGLVVDKNRSISQITLATTNHSFLKTNEAIEPLSTMMINAAN